MHSEDVVKDLLAACANGREDRGYLSVMPRRSGQARAADDARSKGGAGKLLGVPIAIKDVLNVAANLHVRLENFARLRCAV